MTSAARRILGSVIVIGVVAAAGAALYVRGPGPMAFSAGPKVTLADYKGANPTGVPASMAQASVVERGEYLARAADCMVCHTAPGGKEYAGGFAFKMPFGTLYSTNITPDKETGIGSWTDAQIEAAIRYGQKPNGDRLSPVMPWMVYNGMTKEDMDSVVAYLRTVKPVKTEAAKK